MKRLILVALLFVVFGSSVVTAQEEMRPDDRYRGYPTHLIEWPSYLPDLQVCRLMEYYEPSFTNLAQYANLVQIAGERIQETDECRWMLTSNWYRWVLRPRGTRVFVDAQGRDLFDGGSPAGKVCYNPGPFSFIIRPERVVTPLFRERIEREQEPERIRIVEEPLPPLPPEPMRHEPVVTKKGFCSSKKCKLALVAIGGAVAGGAAWYWWPCPPGTVRR